LNYYVYYKVDPAQASDLAPKVAQLFDQVKKQTGVRGRWMRRRDDAATYMEVFEDVKDPAAFEALLDREGAKLGLERKVERFMPVETPS